MKHAERFIKEPLQGVVVAFGDMGDPIGHLHDPQSVGITIDRNFTAAATVLTACLPALEKSENAFIIGLSSVAADRGRASNYVYGAAKAGFSTFLQGLRNTLFTKGIAVLNVKPGFVDTRMTFGKKGLFLVASPSSVAKKILKALAKGKDEIYVPWFWRYIMGIIKAIPEKLFKRLKI